MSLLFSFFFDPIMRTKTSFKVHGASMQICQAVKFQQKGKQIVLKLSISNYRALPSCEIVKYR